MEEMLLEVKGLKTYFFTEEGVVKAVDSVSFNLKKGESLGLVGESGSGKTVTALSVLRIVPKPGKTIEGTIKFNGENLLEKSEKEMQAIRGNQIAIIFQDPSSSLNPVFNIETQLKDVLLAHTHMFSCGMKQRVAIARALALEPTLLFADEPTTALDVTIQAQVLDLLDDLKRKLGMSLVMITHDMGVIAKMTNRVVVLYAGNVCEIARTLDLYEKPKHPYTEALLAAVPRLDIRKTLRVIPGNIPNLIEPPSGCRFHPRCKYAPKHCEEAVPMLEEVEPEHFVACHEWRKIKLKGESGN